MYYCDQLGMDPLTAYYINQSGGGGLGDLIGPVYKGSPYIQQGHGIGSFLGGLFRIVKPVLIQGAKAIGKESLTAGANILSDLAAKSKNQKLKDIVSSRVTESTHKLVNKLKGQGKRKKRSQSTIAKKAKRDIFS